MTDIEANSRVPGLTLRMRRGHGPVARKSIAGQAMVLFVVLVGVLCIGALLLFNTGQVVNRKVQLTNAADAAAYSVAVQQARVMNYAAYMNRGRIANEVAVAQLISLWSWMNMIHTHTVEGWNIFEYLSYIPYVNVIATPLKIAYQAAERVMSVARAALRPVTQVAIEALDTLNQLYAQSADVMLQIGGTEGGWTVARDVVKRNTLTLNRATGTEQFASMPALGQALLIYQLRDAAATGSGGLLDRFSPGRNNSRTVGMDRYRNVVMASRDEFSASRKDEIGIPFIDIETYGGTDMVEYNRWIGMDQLDLEIGIELGFIDLTWDFPMGWGGAQTDPGSNTNRTPAFLPGIRSGGRNARGNGWYSEYHPGNRTYKQYGELNQRSISGRAAANYPAVDFPFFPHRPSGNLKRKRDAYFRNYHGLSAYHDVKDKYGKLPEGPDAGPIFSVYVEDDRQNSHTSEDIDGIGGPAGSQFEMRNGMQGNKMSSIATAQVYFNRAPDNTLFRRLVPRAWNQDPRNDGQLEMGSLFSPYWQARLVETPRSVYTAVGLIGLTGGSP